MRKFNFVATVVISIFVFSLFPAEIKAAQPPIEVSTLYEGNVGWGPSRADPAKAYDKASQQLLFNCYETLITYNQELWWDFIPCLATNIPTRQDITLTITNTSAVGEDPTGSIWIGGMTAFVCVGWVDQLADGFGPKDALFLTDGTSWRTWTVDSKDGSSTITLQLWRGTYTFNVRTSPAISFFDETGSAVDTFDIDDCKYSFARGMVQDQPGPMWMFYKPLFGTMDNSKWDSSTAMDLAHLIDNAFEISGNDFSINLGIRFPDNAFKQILCGTWSSIVGKEFSISIGCWDGDLYSTSKYGGPSPDWWTDWKGIDRSPYDTPDNYRYVGTGPYRVSVFDPASLVVILQKNPGYWRGWPASGRLGSLDTVVIRYIASWWTRKAAFGAGDIDTCDVPRAYMFDILDEVTKDVDRVNWPYVETIKNIVPGPGMTVDTVQFQFIIDPSSTYIGTGSFPDGIPLTFFNNTHVRKAFAYSYNCTNYINWAYFDEADYRQNTLALGLYPDYYNATAAPAYYESLAKAEDELQAATVEGQNVWDSGFTLTIPYESGNDQRRIACEMIRAFFQQLSTYDGRSPYGPPFMVHIAEIDSATFVELAEAHKLPIYVMGRSTDFSDADDCIRPYLHSQGPLALMQGYTAENGWGSIKDLLVDTALLTPDGPAKQALYDQLATIYYDDCPSFPVAEARGRRWTNYWVKGWYYDPLYPSDCYYQIFKADYSWCDVSGPTQGVPDGHVDMRDVNWVMQHNNAKAPVPGQPVDPKWTGVYGCGGCDVYGDRVVNSRDIVKVIQGHDVSDDVAVQTLDSAKTVIGQGYGGNLSLTVENQTPIPEDFNVTTYANTAIISVLNFSFTGSGSQSQVFVWNTSGFAYGNYTLEADADVVQYEIDTADNNYTCTYTVHVGVAGDVSSSTPGVYDGKVSMLDIAYQITLFNTRPSSPNWNPNADVNNDGVVNMIDIAIAILNFNKHE